MAAHAVLGLADVLKQYFKFADSGTGARNSPGGRSPMPLS